MAKNLRTAKDRGRTTVSVKIAYHHWLLSIKEKRRDVKVSLGDIQDRISEKVMALGADFFLK